MSRKKRQLTEEEHRLWHKVASTTRPLAGKPVLHSEKPLKTPSMHQILPVKPGWARPPGPATESHHAPRPRNHYVAGSSPAPAVNNLDRRASRLLGRGRERIDARLDLHGMTQDAAHQALTGFLYRCRHKGIRYVLVITGKSGVLNRMVPIWMGEPVLRIHVSAVTTASARHGGDGALYIRLRRHP